MRCGVKSVTMDDVSRELKISKKTLYKYFKDKPDLVNQVLIQHCKEEVVSTSIISENFDNAIDELIEITKYVGVQLQQIHPSIHYDLEKYYPEAWKVFTEHKEKYIYECVSKNLKRGIDQGLYRSNLNIPIISKIYISRIDIVFDSTVFPVDQFKFTDVHTEMMRYHIRGIASEKGIRYLLEKIKNENIGL